MSVARPSALAGLLAAGSGVFWLNDLLLAVSDWRWWLIGDWAARLAIVLACFVGPWREPWRLRNPPAWPAMLAWTAAIVVGGFHIDLVARLLWPPGGLFTYPLVPAGPWLVLDTFLGIPLVALSEELVARGALFLLALHFRVNPGITILFSGVLFGSYHWSLGLASVAAATASGALLMASVLATRSLVPAIWGHWLLDLVLFSAAQWELAGRSPL